MTTDITTTNPEGNGGEVSLPKLNAPDIPANGTPDELVAAARARGEARKAGGMAPQSGRSGQFIKLDANTGELTYGRNKLPLPVPAKWVVDAFSMRYGYKWWEGGKPTKTADSAALYDPKPILAAGAQMQDRNAGTPGWGEFRSWTMMMLDEGELKGMQCILDLGTATGVPAMDDLIAQVDGRLQAGHGDINPVVEMSIDTTEMSIKQQGGKKRTVFVPVFKIVGWNKTGSTDIAWLDDADDEDFDPLG